MNCVSSPYKRFCPRCHPYCGICAKLSRTKMAVHHSFLPTTHLFCRCDPSHTIRHSGRRFRRLWSLLRHARASNTWPVHAVSSYPFDILFETFVSFSCCQSTNSSNHTAPTHLQIEANYRSSHEVHDTVPVLVKLSRL